MPNLNSRTVLFSISLFLSLTVFANSGIYVGGHFRRDRTVTVPTLKASGFTYVILFNIQVEPNGDLTTDGETICRDGKYVFGTTQPHYVDDVNALRQGMTSIRRVESCIGGWGSKSYDNIKALVIAQGTGPTSILYKNFKALKDTLPVIEAINNDDEHTYNVASATAFHVMLYDLGFKTTLAPYMNKSFWQSLATSVNNQRPGAVDRILIQCYDGGANNNPKDWNINNIELHSGLLHFNTTATITTKMQEWKANSTTTGGFLWVYNANDFNLKNYATAINTVFGGGEVVNVDKLRPHATIYSAKDYSGQAVNFEVGKYVKAGIFAQNFPDKALQSVRLSPGFRMDLFSSDNCTGAYTSITNSVADISTVLTGTVSSWSVRTAGLTTFASKRLYIRNRKSRLYITLASQSMSSGVEVQQKAFDGSLSQRWLFAHLGDGAYRLNNRLSSKSLQAQNANEADNATFTQDTYSSGMHQRFILLPSTDGYFKIMAMHSLKYLAVSGNEANSNIVQTANAADEVGDWELIDESAAAVDALSAVSLKLYPNPATDYLSISTDHRIVKCTEIADMHGRVIQTDMSGSNFLNIQQLNNGLYCCRIWLDGETKPYVLKFSVLK